MDNHEPPVYRSAYELALAITRFVKDCPGEYKLTLGQRLQSEVLNMFNVIQHVNEKNNNADKANDLQKALNQCFYLRMILRLMLDISIMKMETSVALNFKIDDVAKQLTGWRKSMI